LIVLRFKTIAFSVIDSEKQVSDQDLNHSVNPNTDLKKFFTDLKLFNEAEMGYVAGIAAAHANQAYFYEGYTPYTYGSLSVVVVTGLPDLLTKRYMNGFKNGVLKACPDCNVLRIIGYNNVSALNDFQGMLLFFNMSSFQKLLEYILIELLISNGGNRVNILQFRVQYG
jgi:hypothetical protein